MVSIWRGLATGFPLLSLTAAAAQASLSHAGALGLATPGLYTQNDRCGVRERPVRVPAELTLGSLVSLVSQEL